VGTWGCCYSILLPMLIYLSYYVDKYIRSILGINVLSNEVKWPGRKTNH